MSKLKILVLAFLTLIVVALLAYGFMPKPLVVDAASVERKPLAVTVEEEGRTRVIDRYLISAPVAAYAERIEHDVGDVIKTSDRLVMLEPLRSTVLDPRSRAEAEAAVASAQAALRAAERRASAAAADAEFASTDAARMQRLYESRTVSRDAVDRAEKDARRTRETASSARAEIDVARYELKAAETALFYSAAEASDDDTHVTVLSPVEGTVLKLHHESEGVVTAGAPLMEIGDPHALEIEVDVLSADAVRIHPGTRVLLERWGGEAMLEATVRSIEPVGFTKVSALGVEEQRVWVIADITSPFEDWSRLGDGYRVEARFVIWESDNVLQAPASALFRTGDTWAVFVIEEGRALERLVEIGQHAGLVVQITKGLKEGDWVVVHPGSTITNGRRVLPRDS